jgi:hypothetical protein
VLVGSLDPAAWEEAVRGVLLDPARCATLVTAGRAAARDRRIESTVVRTEKELLRTLEETA